MRIEIHTPHGGRTGNDACAFVEVWNAGASAVVRAINKSPDANASCAIWTRDLPTLSGKRLGYVGRFSCTDGDAAVVALKAACDWLARDGCHVAVGPVDGSTWHGYRFVTESSAEPAFAKEPTNPPEWPDLWKSAGFMPVASYHSSLNDELTLNDPLLDDASSRARAAGLCLRPLNMAEFDRELRAIYEVSLNAFAENFLYTPIAWEEFAAMYAPMKNLLDPRLVLLADDPVRPGRLAGYMMAFPDYLEHQRTGECRTVILKSLAVHTDWRSVRLGTWLVAQAQSNAKALGMNRSIFALMHDANPSARIGKHYSRVIRRYTLFRRESAP